MAAVGGEGEPRPGRRRAPTCAWDAPDEPPVADYFIDSCLRLLRLGWKPERLLIRSAVASPAGPAATAGRCSAASVWHAACMVCADARAAGSGTIVACGVRTSTPPPCVPKGFVPHETRSSVRRCRAGGPAGGHLTPATRWPRPPPRARWCSPTASPPCAFSYLAGADQPVGFSVDLGKAILAEVKKQTGKPGLEVGWQAVTRGQPDPAAGQRHHRPGVRLHHQQQRARQEVDFAINHFYTGTRLLVKKSAGIKDWADLKGRKVAITTGTTNTCRWCAATTTTRAWASRSCPPRTTPTPRCWSRPAAPTPSPPGRHPAVRPEGQ